MTPLPTNGVSDTFAIGRNHVPTVFGKKPTEVGSEAESYLGESSAALGHTPLHDATEIIREGNEKCLEREAYQRSFVLISPPHLDVIDGERIREETPTTPKNK